jgi:putative lipoic acid-binding regulatory protein
MKDPNFKLLLDQNYKWPGPYTYKIIVPEAEIGKVETLFAKAENVSKKTSRTGKYVSFTGTIMTESSDEVVEYYHKMASIPGAVAL